MKEKSLRTTHNLTKRHQEKIMEIRLDQRSKSDNCSSNRSSVVREAIDLLHDKTFNS